MRSAKKWKAHTSTDLFAQKFNTISDQYEQDNEARTEKIERFLIAEAIEAGVV
jgi:hypothetical protein